MNNSTRASEEMSGSSQLTSRCPVCQFENGGHSFECPRYKEFEPQPEKCCEKCVIKDSVGVAIGCHDSNHNCPCHQEPTKPESDDLSWRIDQMVCSKENVKRFVGYAVKQAKEEVKKEMVEKIKKSKLFKMGGSCFECCDYEDICNDVLELLKGKR